MKVTKLPPTRTNVSIELTPDEQDALFTLLSCLSGVGPIRHVADDLYEALIDSGSQAIAYEKLWDLKLYW